MDLGKKIKNIRYYYNISQEEMAKKLKINRNYLSRIETNKSMPTAEVLTRIAEEFNLSVDALLGVNIDNKNNEEMKLEKVNRITELCNNLSNTELDFVINVLEVVSNKAK